MWFWREVLFCDFEEKNTIFLWFWRQMQFLVILNRKEQILSIARWRQIVSDWLWTKYTSLWFCKMTAKNQGNFKKEKKTFLKDFSTTKNQQRIKAILKKLPFLWFCKIFSAPFLSLASSATLIARCSWPILKKTTVSYWTKLQKCFEQNLMLKKCFWTKLTTEEMFLDKT